MVFIAGNKFPTTLLGPAVAQHEESFYIIGGLDYYGKYLDSIYHYNVMDDSWTLLQDRMEYPRCYATAMIVNSLIFPSCD